MRQTSNDSQLKLGVIVSSSNTHNATNVITSLNVGMFALHHQETFFKMLFVSLQPLGQQ